MSVVDPFASFSESPNARTIIVGVVHGQPESVVAEAAKIAERFSADLICACVDVSRYTVDQHDDGTVTSLPIDPDLVGDADDQSSSDLEGMVGKVLANSSVSWSFLLRAGGAAHELSQLAEEFDAEMIVVGTREAGIKGSLHEFFNGSVAVQLAHRQHRPVLVVPLNPVTGDGEVPWASDDEPSGRR